MKKIYSLICLFLVVFSGSAQEDANYSVDLRNQSLHNTSKIKKNNVARTNGNTVSGRFDPAYAVMTTNGVLDTEIGGGSSGTKIGMFVTGTNCDSTLKTSFSTTANFITTHKFGMNFDPSSVVFDQVNFLPLLTPTDAYYVDTVWVGCFYQRKTSYNDTLMLELVWGDTTNTSVYAGYSFASPNGYFGTMRGPLFNAAPGVQGNASFLSAPQSNKLTIKYVLTDSDTTLTNNTGYIPVAINGGLGQLIPADNIVSGAATYVSGQPGIPVGTVAYNPGAGSFPQTVNGMVARLYVQNNPATPTAGSAWLDDPGSGKNHTVYSFKRERYGMTGAFPGLRSSTTRAYMMDFSIHTPVTTGVKELEQKGFALGQNIPNPFTKESTINYNLVKDASSAIFTVTDVMGRVITTEKVTATAGNHSIKVGSYAAGIYYYSLNVDGNVSTRKMIVE